MENSSIETLCPLCRKENIVIEAYVGLKPYWHCHECRIIFLSPEHRLDSNAERARYLEHENNSSDPRYRKFLSRLARHLTPHLSTGAHGLDYGAGPGPTLSLMLEEQGFSMSIYDPFFAPDTSALEDTYDFITCTETVEHFFNPACEFRRLNSMLKPGGWLGIMTEMVMPEQKFKDW